MMSSNYNVFMVVFRLSETAGGITRVVLNRADFFSQNGFNTGIITLEYDDNLLNIIEGLISDKRMEIKPTVLNFFYYYANLYSRKKNLNDLKIKIFRKSILMDSSGLKKTVYFLDDGSIFAEEVTDRHKNSLSFSIFLNNGSNLQFQSKGEAQNQWVKKLGEKDNYTFIISEAWRFSRYFSMIQSKNISTILALHGNHLDKPYTIGAKTKPSSLSVIKSSQHCDALVVLSETQKKDINNSYALDNIYSISNSVTKFNHDDYIKKEENLCIVISRLVPL